MLKTEIERIRYEATFAKNLPDDWKDLFSRTYELLVEQIKEDARKDPGSRSLSYSVANLPKSLVGDKGFEYPGIQTLLARKLTKEGLPSTYDGRTLTVKFADLPEYVDIFSCSNPS